VLALPVAELTKGLRLSDSQSWRGFSTFEAALTLGSLHRVIQGWRGGSLKGGRPGEKAKVDVSLNGQPLGKEALTVTSWGARAALPAAVLSQPGTHTLRWSTSGVTQGQVNLTRALPLAEQQPVAGAFALSRRVYRLSVKGQREELKEGAPLRTGDLLWVEYRVEAPKAKGWATLFGGLMTGSQRAPFEGRYYWLKDSIPAGFEPVEDDQTFRSAPYSLPLAGRYAERLIGTDSVSWAYAFAKGWMERFEPVGYVARVRYAGKFAWPAAVMEDFYFPELSSRTGGTRIEVHREPQAR
jgi:hypothetical protein